MNWDKLKKDGLGGHVELAPPACFLDEQDGEIRQPSMNEWIVQAFPQKDVVTLQNAITFQSADLGKDHIYDFRSNPIRSTSEVRYGFLVLKVQIFVKGKAIWLEPNRLPGESVAAIRRIEQLEKEAARVKAAAAPRQLTEEQKEALRVVLSSDLFQKRPKPALRVAAVSDAEAQMYAMQFMRLFESCKVNIYPTNGGLPLNIVQHEPSADGLQLIVKSMTNPNPAFVQFQRLVHSLGIAIPVGIDPSFRDNEAMLEIMKKAN
jgi:hypothetical protein